MFPDPDQPTSPGADQSGETGSSHQRPSSSEGPGEQTQVSPSQSEARGQTKSAPGPRKPTTPPADRSAGWKEDPSEPGRYWYWTGSRYLLKTVRRKPEEPSSSTDTEDSSISWGLVAVGLVIMVFGFSMISQVDWSAMTSGDSQAVQREVEDGSGLLWVIGPVVFLIGLFLAGAGLFAPLLNKEDKALASEAPSTGQVEQPVAPERVKQSDLPPGWYPSPVDSFRRQYWDGSSWGELDQRLCSNCAAPLQEPVCKSCGAEN